MFSLLIAAFAALLYHTGAFRAVDDRFFDFVTTHEAGSIPEVVIVQRDRNFEAGGDRRFVSLNRALNNLGVERIGYLPLERGDDLASLTIGTDQSRNEAVVGLPAQRVPASDLWEISRTTDLPNGQFDAGARVLATAGYGIHRSQLVSLAGVDGAVPLFETALAGTSPSPEPYLLRMSRKQNIPVIKASQLLAGELQGNELEGLVAIVATGEAMEPVLATPLTPQFAATSEAMFRAYAVQTLRSGGTIYRVQIWQAVVLLICTCLVSTLCYLRSDPKRFALPLAFGLTMLAIAGSWAALQFAGQLLPLTALAVAPWLVSFHAVLMRERKQDRVLEETAARAVQKSFRRSALREGARLPEFLGFSAQLAGIDRCLLIERSSDGEISAVLERGASIEDLVHNRKILSSTLSNIRLRNYAYPADELVPTWQGQTQIAWLGGADRDLYWIYALPEDLPTRKSAHLVRAVSASFRELFHWRAHINARSQQDERFRPIDGKIASAINLVAREAEHIRHGFDTIETAVVIFHLIGSPLHANARMEGIYAEAGLAVPELSLPEAVRALTSLDEGRINALLEDLALNGGEMRMPMRKIGPADRILRVAAPKRFARGGERVVVLEAVDVSEHHRAADLRQAVALYIDLQLRNDFEAIMLGVDLAGDERIPPEKIRPIIGRIGDSAKRATERLDRVAELVHGEANDLLHASYPIDVSKALNIATDKAAGLAGELSVEIKADMAGIGGFTIAEPKVLAEMVEAMLRVIIADTPRGESVKLKVEEESERTHIRISGGFGMGFERLVRLLEDTEAETVGEFRTISESIRIANKWGASVSYWGHAAHRFGFNIDLRRIG